MSFLLFTIISIAAVKLSCQINGHAEPRDLVDFAVPWPTPGSVLLSIFSGQQQAIIPVGSGDVLRIPIIWLLQHRSTSTQLPLEPSLWKFDFDLIKQLADL